MRSQKLSALVLILTAAALLMAGVSAAAQTEKVLFSFNDSNNIGANGITPKGGLIFDGAGDLYGTTAYGGSPSCVLDSSVYGCGVVFELTPQSGGGWSEDVLHRFVKNGKDGLEPFGDLIFDGSGNLFGTTTAGGVSSNCTTQPGGCGTVFELTPTSSGWHVLILHSFDFNNKFVDGETPIYGSLIFDAAGNLYGTTNGGGHYGRGIVFELTPTSTGWTEKILHSFNNNGKDGFAPFSGVIFDAAGDLYGTTNGGGKYGGGTVFELTPNTMGWSEKILYSFGNGTDASGPEGSVIFDGAGNLYGTTQSGGLYGHGALFMLTPAAGGAWTETFLHNFNTDGTDGAWPNPSLIWDASGNLYGTTQFGGSLACTGGCGTVFEFSPQPGGTWSEKILHPFAHSGGDGFFPASGLVFDGSGNLYGTTQNGGAYGYGTVYEVTP